MASFALFVAQNMKLKSKFRQIDELLTKECLFCGSLLIDMIDNDIVVLNTERVNERDDYDEIHGIELPWDDFETTQIPVKKR